MSVVPAPSAGWFDHALKSTVVTLSWLAVVLATEILCRPWPGTELVVPVVVAVAATVVTLIGRIVGSALVLFFVALLAMTSWGEVGGVVLVASTIAALQLLPVHAIRPGQGRGR